jgi:hypothetical protein
VKIDLLASFPLLNQSAFNRVFLRPISGSEAIRLSRIFEWFARGFGFSHEIVMSIYDDNFFSMGAAVRSIGDKLAVERLL